MTSQPASTIVFEGTRLSLSLSTVDGDNSRNEESRDKGRFLRVRAKVNVLAMHDNAAGRPVTRRLDCDNTIKADYGPRCMSLPCKMGAIYGRAIAIITHSRLTELKSKFPPAIYIYIYPEENSPTFPEGLNGAR